MLSIRGLEKLLEEEREGGGVVGMEGEEGQLLEVEGGRGEEMFLENMN